MLFNLTSDKNPQNMDEIIVFSHFVTSQKNVRN